MKKVFIIFWVCTSFIACGQKKETMENKKVTELFIQNYNSKNYKSIFEMFSNEMKAFLPISKLESFLENERSNSGKIKDYTFIKFKQSVFALYKMDCENSILSLQIAIDENSKIIGLDVNSFEQEIILKEAGNKLTSKNNNISQQQADLIYNNSKNYPNNTQVAFAIIKNGKTQFYGIQRILDTISTINNHQSIFEIGSISKVFTSTLLADFVLKKSIKLNDHINDYFNFNFKNNTKITFESLANHTSGLAKLPSNLDFENMDPSNPYKSYSEEDLEEYLKEYLTLENKGTSQYSNLGTGLLAYTLTKTKNKSFEDLLQQRVFSKYNMSNSTTERNKVTLNFVEGLDLDGNITHNWDFGVLGGCGAILSNVEDLSQFVLAQFNTSNTSLQLTHTATVEINPFNASS